jgi:hypothetical protein
MDQSFEADKHALPRGNRTLASERELLRVQASLKNDPGCLDWSVHARRVGRDQDVKAVRRPTVGPTLGTLRRYS